MKKILIIDSLKNEQFIQKISKYCEVICLEESAFEESLINDLKISLIILNKDVSGFEKILENESIRNIPVIILSDGTESDYELILRENVVDVIKSYCVEEVLIKKINLYTEMYEYKTAVEKMVEKKIMYMEHTQDVMIKSIMELVECRDIATGGHIKRTALYMRVLLNILEEDGEFLEMLTPNFKKDLIIASPLHDIGKVGIDDATLRKSSALDSKEFELMKQHAMLGGVAIGRIIEEVGEASFLIVAKEMAETHHENWDGTGYPNGLKGEEIPLSGRIMAIVDVYDAITAVRPYKKAINHEEAVEIICNKMKSKFDPKILNVFKKNHERFKNLEHI